MGYGNEPGSRKLVRPRTASASGRWSTSPPALPEPPEVSTGVAPAEPQPGSNEAGGGDPDTRREKSPATERSRGRGTNTVEVDESGRFHLGGFVPGKTPCSAHR